MDDAFAAMFEVTEGGIDKFIEDVKENMQREADVRVSQDIREQVIAALLETNDIDIPKALKHQEMHAMQREAMQRLGVEDVAQAPALDNFAEVAEKTRATGLVNPAIDHRSEALGGCGHGSCPCRANVRWI